MSDEIARTTRNRSNTRQRLLEAAAAVFAEIGVGAASVEMITERAGFTRGAFYSNFDSQDDLFFQLVQWVSENKLGEVSDRVRELEAEGLAGMPVDVVLHRILEAVVGDAVGVRVMSEFRSRAMRDERTAAAYRKWQRDLGERVEGLVADVARGTGLELTLPSAELADIVMIIWEGTAVEGVIEGLDQEPLTALILKRTVAVVSALVAANTA
ncbi:TetR/AcrR family transcriptional regulator [Microbacterium gorillae]|uniref:TetR/AcrR family transcriptional regulator n=1 Tax=Microbacterium gorillae TaxID=1231063 RepID=UPI000590DC78|nr:TetR/AcrR family transcriptional regulator [Microbacterium gorillae]